jgi:hypothetical protein
LAAALASLPHLTSLMLGEGAKDDLCAVLSTADGQLTHLSLSSDDYELETTLCKLLEGPVIPLSMRQLRSLVMGCATVGDALLRVLTAHLPLLTYVHVCSICLCTSHADAACNWEELSVEETLYTDDLARLPLRGIRTLGVCSFKVHSSYNRPGETAAALAAALAAAPDCALGFPCAPELELDCSAEELAVLLPRWQCGAMERLTLAMSSTGTDCLTPAAVAALGSMLQRTPSCKELSIEGFAPPDPKSAPLLLPALRNTAIRKVQLRHPKLTEAQLMAWCAGCVGRPIVVDWSGKLEGYLLHVNQALEAAGGDVRLECNCDDDSSRVPYRVYKRLMSGY